MVVVRYRSKTMLEWFQHLYILFSLPPILPPPNPNKIAMLLKQVSMKSSGVR